MGANQTWYLTSPILTSLLQWQKEVPHSISSGAVEGFQDWPGLLAASPFAGGGRRSFGGVGNQRVDSPVTKTILDKSSETTKTGLGIGAKSWSYI